MLASSVSENRKFVLSRISAVAANGSVTNSKTSDYSYMLSVLVRCAGPNSTAIVANS